MGEGGETATKAGEEAAAPPPAPASSAASTGRRHRRRARRWVTQESVGAAAFLLGLSLAGVNVVQAIRGPDIVVAVQPESIYLYRDAGPHLQTLSMAVRVPLVNRASADYGDVVRTVHATLSPLSRRDGPRFPYQSLAEPTFPRADQVQSAVGCDIRTRCVVNRGIVVLERERQLVDLPGGAARDQYFGFNLDRAYCESTAAACAPFGDFDSAVRALATAPMRVSIAVTFTSARRREAQCAIQLTPARADYLRDRGWVAVPCL